EVRQRAQRVLDGVGERLLGAADGGEVDQLRGQAGGVQREVKRGVGHAVDPNPPGAGPLSTPGSAAPVLSSTLYACRSRPFPPSVAAACSASGRPSWGCTRSPAIWWCSTSPGARGRRAARWSP